MEQLERPIVGSSSRYTQRYVTNIRTGRGGQWEYSPRFKGTALRIETQIQLTGRRTQDYLRAEARARVRHQGRVTVWHHVHDYQDGWCTMQLVNWRNHTATIPHAGGCKQYSEAHGGQPYRAIRPMPPGELQEMLDDLTVSAPPRHSTQELQAFTLSTGKTLPTLLQELLRGDRTISKKGLATLATQHDLCLDALLPVKDAAKCANITGIMDRLGRCEMTLAATPFGIDPYGNEAWVADSGRLYLYDHETGENVPLDPDLQDILD